MKKGGRRGLVLGVVALLSWGCGDPQRQEAPPVAPSPPAPGQAAPLTREDLQALLAVRGRALQRLEESLEEVVRSGGDVATRVQELSAAEREAAAALGVDWRRYLWVREEVARLVALQRQEEDVALLLAELDRAQEELQRQLRHTRDPASREFLQAQQAVLQRQRAKLQESEPAAGARGQALHLLEAFRAELAMQQSRQEKLQRRLRELLRSHPALGQNPLAGGESSAAARGRRGDGP